ALNRWRLIYLVWAGGWALRSQRVPKTVHGTLLAGATLWLAHDVAHARWRAVFGDILAVAGLLSDKAMLTVAGIALAASKPEAEPSPFIWSSWARPRDTSSAPAAHRSASPGRPAMRP